MGKGVSIKGTIPQSFSLREGQLRLRDEDTGVLLTGVAVLTPSFVPCLRQALFLLSLGISAKGK